MLSNITTEQALAESSATYANLEELVNKAEDFEAFCYCWLELQCQQKGRGGLVSSAVLIMREAESQVFKPEAKWPLKSELSHLAEIAYALIEEQCALVVPIEERGSQACAYPINVNGELIGVVVLELQSMEGADVDRIMTQLQWSCAWVSLFVNKNRSAGSDLEASKSKRAIELLARVQSSESALAAMQNLCSLVATEFSLDRVAYGSLEAGEVRLQALSHSASFSQRSALISAIQRAMEESFVAGDILFYPCERHLSAIDHKALLEKSDSTYVASLPIYLHGECISVLSLEGQRELQKSELEFIQALALLSVPCVEDKRRAQQSILATLKQRSLAQAQLTIGANYTGRKLILLTLFSLGLFFALMRGEYRLGAEALLEGEVQRVMAAPYSGYIAAAQQKVGDELKAGQFIYELDNSELVLEKKRWLSERAKYRHEYDNAYAKKQSADMNISRAQMEQARAQLNLTEDKLKRSKVLAPFDGVLISGDLSQRLGDYVEQGEELFKLAPLNSYRLMLLVQDNRINDVEKAQSGQLIISSMPGEKFSFTIRSITAETEAKDGANYFRVEAELNVDAEQLESLRPGMQGLGKISVDRRLLIDIWTRSFREWLSLKLWSWF